MIFRPGPNTVHRQFGPEMALRTPDPQG